MPFAVFTTSYRFGWIHNGMFSSAVPDTCFLNLQLLPYFQIGISDYLSLLHRYRMYRNSSFFCNVHSRTLFLSFRHFVICFQNCLLKLFSNADQLSALLICSKKCRKYNTNSASVSAIDAKSFDL